MKIYIDRTHCDLCQSYCDRHVAKLIRSPLGRDRRSFNPWWMTGGLN